MPIDTSIVMRGVQPVQLPDPVNRMAQVLQLQGAMRERHMADKALAETNAVNEAYRSALGQDGAVDRNKLFQTLATGGMGARIPKLQKDFAEVDKATAEVGKTKVETDAKAVEVAHKRVDAWGQAMGFVRQNPTPENAVAAVQHLVTMGIMPPEKAQAAVASLQADPSPQNVARFAELGFRAALSAKEQLPTFQTRNTGGTTDTLAIDPVTQQVRVANSVRNTQSPDNAASVAVQMRGQNMTDARARELNEINRQAARTQVLETPQGVLLVDKGTGQARPATAGGQPIPGKPSAAVEKELVGLRQQNAIVDGALAAVDKTPSAFSMGRGMATMAGPIPESVAGRFDNDAERQARSYVFNNVSKVINERAGAAQSAQELARLRSFLPAETDNAEQIKSKLKAFKSYLNDMESGTRGSPAGAPAAGASGGWGIQRVN